MKTLWQIAARDFTAWFRSPIGWWLAALVLCLDALQLHAVAIGTERRPSAAVLELFLLNAAVLTEVLVAFVALRLPIDEGHEAGALLLTSPVGEGSLVLGRFLGAFGYVAVVTLLSLHLPALILVNGKISFGHVATGYLGLLLVGAGGLAIASAAAAIARRPFGAALTTAGVLAGLELAHRLASIADLEHRPILRAIAPVFGRFTSFRQGLFQLSDVVFFVLLTYLGLRVATRALAGRREA
ncbi:MAG: hypothetical protein H6724_10795 [Sandaracinus sp.]|nr:hypothetical protein [Sandaracinus sp.]MCB9619921.1 hypothetical protein [Sandaracinus sp.]